MKRIAFYAPAPMKGSGGVGRIYTFAKALGRAGYECHVLVTNSHGREGRELAQAANDCHGATGFVCHPTTEAPAGIFDLAIATQWETVPLVQGAPSHAKAYLIQDFEAYFNPVGDGSVFAENSYMQGLWPLTYGRWLAHKLKSEFGNEPFFFEFASDTNVFRCQRPMARRLEGPPKIAFVFQDNKPRRCPHLGVEALSIVKHVRPDVQIYFVGSSQEPSLWYEANSLGNLSLRELNNVYNECQVGLSLSSSNPSCNPFDMMAAGLPSVDLYRENNLFDTPKKGVLLALQTRESVAEAILHLINNPKELTQRSEYGIRFMQSRPQEREVQSFLAAVDAIVGGRGHSASKSDIASLFYDAPPVVAKIDRNAFADAFLHNQRLEAGGAGRKAIKSPQYYPTNELQITDPAKVDTEGHRASQEAQALPPAKRRRHERILRWLQYRHGVDSRLCVDMFDRAHYLSGNPDVLAAGMDPFMHFVEYGHSEGRSPSPHFDASWYEDAYSQVIKPGVSAIDDYLFEGSALNRSPNAFFDATWYLNRNKDVAEAGLHPVFHYAMYGEAENRDPSEGFSTSWYRANNPDVVKAAYPLLLHYLHHGLREGRPSAPPTVVHAASPQSLRKASAKTSSVFDALLLAEDSEPQGERQEVHFLDPAQRRGQVSFDIWSTVLHRRCHPDEIKLRSARFLLLSAWGDVLPGYRDVVTLMNARLRAENASAPNGDFEYSFGVAVHAWLGDVLNSSCPPEARQALADAIIRHEFEAERSSVELDPNAARTIRSLLRPPIFISDFYMPASFVQNLLHDVGIGAAFATGYASCDTYLNKRSGALFGHVLKDLGLAARDLTHIGDNAFSDWERPRALGINAVRYVSDADEQRHAWYEKGFHALCTGDVAHHHRRLLALAKKKAAERAEAANAPEGELYDAGCHLGLLAFGYCLNVMQDAIIRKAKEVVFFTREGILFKQIYDLLAEHNPFGLPAPPSKLLSVSRKATFAASLRSFEVEELMRLWSMYWKQSPLAFAASLNLDVDIVSQAARRSGLKPEEVVEAPWADARFLSLLSDPELRRHAEAEISAQREKLKRYLAQELVPDQEEILICDIGWRGTIQDNLARVIETPVRGHYFALLGFLNEQPTFSSKVGWLSDLNQGSDYEIPDQLAVIEMVFNGPGGSTIGYEVEADGTIIPLKQVFEGEEAVVRALEVCRAGMAAVVPQLARYVNLHGLVAENLRDLGRTVVDDLVACPPAVIADLFAKLQHNETFGAGSLDVMQTASLQSAFAEPPGQDMYAALLFSLGDRWPEGLARQSVVRQWWEKAGPRERSSVPLAITRSVAPAIVRSTGSRLAVYLSEQVLASDRLESILRVTQGLTEVGFQADLYLRGLNADDPRLGACLGNMGVSVTQAWSAHRNAGLAMATDAASASYVRSSVVAHASGYLVQDDEAHAANDLIVAENSYAYGLSHFTLGNWLTHMINNRYVSPAYPAQHGVDTTVYKQIEGARRGLAVCMRYDPNQPQGLLSLALDSLALLKKRRPDVRVLLFGAENGPSVDFDYENLGRMHHADLLNEVFNQCAAGLSLSTSNPARMTFEMAAAGCVPVGLYRYNNLMDLDERFSVLAFQSAPSLAQALIQVLDAGGDLDGQAARASTCFRNRTLMWERDAAVANIVGVLEGRTHSDWGSAVLYNADPVIAPVDDVAAVRAFCGQQLSLATSP